MSQIQYGSFLPFRFKRRYLVVFMQSNFWLFRLLWGYTHVCLVELYNDNIAVCYEPNLYGMNTIVREWPTLPELKGLTVFEVTVLPRSKNRLVRPIFQTCATIVQYLMNISLNCCLANSFYRKLHKMDMVYLNRNGISRIKRWET